ncbi:hypothetical protein Lalb_Chr11g0066901 [Lupinus albus]|uniref:IQ motif, EF-hand binding protein n=1 Tax=Lupinus albus TaxID=3870 RepID=A0A6A4PR63_LUPAL|nr:hypothetical protein Lalb_Chr11g0066901 [Lupinus albus]
MSPMTKLLHANGWDNRHQSSHKIRRNDFSKHEAAIKRERALAYAFYCQQQNLEIDPNGYDIERYENEHEAAQWSLEWLEQWTSQPHHVMHLGGPHEMTLTTTTTDNMSEEKTVEMHMVTPSDSTNSNMGLMGQEFLDSSPMSNRYHQREDSSGVPGYMTPTQSAKAKVQGLFR